MGGYLPCPGARRNREKRKTLQSTGAAAAVGWSKPARFLHQELRAPRIAEDGSGNRVDGLVEALTLEGETRVRLPWTGALRKARPRVIRRPDQEMLGYFASEGFQRLTP